MKKIPKLGPDDPLPSFGPVPQSSTALDHPGVAKRGGCIYYKVESRSAAWYYLRLGRPTASEFHRIVTPTGKNSTQAEDYSHRLLAELMLGKPLEEGVQTEWMLRGQELEDGAIEAYEFQSGLTTSLGGFCTDDEGQYGCSPDRLVGDDGVLEMKCPAPNTHVGYLDDPESLTLAKRPQVQGELLVTGRQWCDLVSFHPELPAVIRRVKRDEKYIDTLRVGLSAFCRQLIVMRANLEQQYGAFKPIVIPSEQPVPAGPMAITDEDLDWCIAQHAKEPA